VAYEAPIKDMLFCMTELAGLDEVAALPGFEDAGVDTALAVLEECARFNEGVLAPLNQVGDKNPSTWADGSVTTTPGFTEAYRQFAEGGWQGLQHPLAFGGQGLPKTIGAACIEINNSANLSFALCPLLTDGAIEALLTAGSDELKQAYLPRMVSGEWTGTMNLTEPQAGSDLALVRTRAEPQEDGSYASSARRSSSRTASTTWPRTSCTWCWRASAARPKASRASACSWCRSSARTATAASGSATTCSA
jgi:alkylation response protein AidB-like acyl-CoA dehydrogenase